MSMHREKSTYSVQTVEKALEILEVLTEDHACPNLPYLAETLGLSRNKVFRILATLEEKGLVEREDTTGCYRLGLPAAELAQKVLKSVSLIQIAHPVMESLARKHDEAVYMTVISGDDVIFLDMVDSAQQVKAAPLVGERFPFFTNAAGKAIRALESRDILERFFRKRARRETVPNQKLLEDELNQIRSRGVAVDSGGLGEGVITVAVAVRDYAGKVVGALTLLGPSFRMLSERLENEIIPSLMEGAEILSFKFGYAKL
jgi:DNA-binding IclR family transcriptional regulator